MIPLMPSASAEDQGSAQTIKSILSKTGHEEFSLKKEAKKKVTFNDVEEVRYLFKDDYFEESADDDDFYYEAYVSSFSGYPTGHDNMMEENIPEEIIVEDIEDEDHTNVTSRPSQQSGENDEIQISLLCEIFSQNFSINPVSCTISCNSVIFLVTIHLRPAQ